MVKLSPEIKEVMQPADALAQLRHPRPMATLSATARALLDIEDQSVDEDGYPIAPLHLIPAIEADTWCCPTRNFLKTDKDLENTLRIYEFCYQLGRLDALKGGGD